MRILRCVLILLSCAFCATASPQEPPERVQGITLFKQDDIAGAIKLLTTTSIFTDRLDSPHNQRSIGYTVFGAR